MGPQQEQNRRSRDAHQPDERPRHRRKDLHDRGSEAGKVFGPPQGQPLRHEFTEQQGEEREQRNKHGQGDRPGGSLQAQRAIGCEPLCQHTHHLVTAVGRRQRTDERDADLHGRQELVGAQSEVKRFGSRLITLLRQLPQPAPAAGDNGHLRTGKKTVGEDQREHDQQLFKYRWHQPVASGSGSVRPGNCGSSR